MDLTYMPGELDFKNAKKGDDTSMKRDHDSVDDFEHLDPDLSPVDSHPKDKSEILKSANDHDLSTDLIEKSHGDTYGLPSVPVLLESGKISPDSKPLSDFLVEGKEIKTEVDFHSDSEGKSSLLDFGMKDDNTVGLPEFNKKLIEDHSSTKNFISAESAINNDKTENETPVLDIKPQISAKEDEESETVNAHAIDSYNDVADTEPELSSKTKSMKEDDALPQYELKYDSGLHVNEHVVGQKPSETTQKLHTDDTSNRESEIDSHEDVSEFVISKDFGSSEKFEEPHVDELAKPESITKPNPPPPPKDSVKTAISDLDDIIGPEDVFKRIGLVEALVYWRDPKKSGVVFGGGMVILLSLCVMSLISVIAYTSLFALMATICFRIYKNILQAVQKTSEGHPFKEFLDLELSLPQDKVREVVDTAVVHINAAIVELRRLFLVEDLIDSIKFGVCLWCLTYVGAIFNGMTLVILAFVALFTVPKIYENNKASIDQYIEMGRSKVAEITSKVKAAVPIGKKEPEKDKEQ